MASVPFAMPDKLLTLGLFVFGMDTLGYADFERRMAWRHSGSERHMARNASQYVGPGEDTITLSGQLVPGVTGTYGSLDRLIEMAETGDNWQLMDGMGRVLGRYRIVGLDQTHRHIMAGGLPRSIDFTLTLERAD